MVIYILLKLHKSQSSVLALVHRLTQNKYTAIGTILKTREGCDLGKAGMTLCCVFVLNQ